MFHCILFKQVGSHLEQEVIPKKAWNERPFCIVLASENPPSLFVISLIVESDFF